jgi:hypothetical protein
MAGNLGTNMGRDRKTWSKGIPPYLALALMVLVVYLPTYPGYFVGDDYTHLIFSMKKSFLGMLDPKLTRYPVEVFYRPVGLLLWKVNYSLFGLAPGGYWITNIGLHVLNTLLLFVLLKKVAGSTPTAFVSSALYGVYPLQSESVLWFTGRYYLTCIFFILLCLIFFAKYLDTKRVRCLAVSIVFDLLALFSNEAAVVLPALLAVTAFLLLQADRPGRRFYKSLTAALPYAGMTILYLAARFLYYKSIGGYSYATGGGIYQKLVSGEAAANLFGTIGRMLFPINAYVLGERPWIFYCLFVIYAAILLLAAASRRVSSNNILTGISWVFFSLLPFVFILRIEPGLTGNRFVAVAAVGFCFVLGSMLLPGRAGKGYLKISGYVLSALLVCSFSYITYRNDTAWSDAFFTAREIPRQVKEMYPSLPAGSELFFMDVPEYEKGVFVYQHGLRPSINFAYGYKDYKPLKAYFVYGDGNIKDQKYTDLKEPNISEVLQKRGNDVLIFRWDGASGKLMNISPRQGSTKSGDER